MGAIEGGEGREGSRGGGNRGRGGEGERGKQGWRQRVPADAHAISSSYSSVLKIMTTGKLFKTRFHKL